MKSTIKIALGEQNQPVINFNVCPTDDLRDQLCCQFIHGLQQTSNLCYVSIDGGNMDENGKIYHSLQIHPIPADPKEFMQKLCKEQLYSVVTRAFQALDVDTMKELLDNETGVLCDILKKATSNQLTPTI